MNDVFEAVNPGGGATGRDAQLAQVVTPSLPGAGTRQGESEASESQAQGGGTSPAITPTITPSLPGSSSAAGGAAAGGATVSPSLPGSGQPAISPSLPGSALPQPAPSSETAPSDAASGNDFNIVIRNPDNIQLPPGSSQIELVLREDKPIVPDRPVDGGAIGFLEILTALILALMIAPYLQKESGRLIRGLNALAFVQKHGLIISAYLLIFTFGWIVFMIVLPQLYMFDFSFRFNLPPPEVGGPKDVYTLKNYRYLLFGQEGGGQTLNWLHLGVFVKTIVASVCVTLLNFALCYPLAYYMAQSVSGRSQRLLFLCLLLPFWINEILRAFAFKLIFAEQGLLNNALIGLGIWDTPFDFLRADVALYTGLTYAYLLLMIFPLYNAIESLDHNQIEAARDMGASWPRIHFRVVMPYAKPGIASGCTMVFMLTAGALAAPNILGGPSSLWFTQIIYQWYNTGGNWPQGSAYAFVLLFICIAFVMTMMRVAKVSLGDLAKR